MPKPVGQRGIQGMVSVKRLVAAILTIACVTFLIVNTTQHLQMTVLVKPSVSFLFEKIMERLGLTAIVKSRGDLKLPLD